MYLLLVLALLGTARALSSWYTPPGGPPTGSTPGDKIRGVNLGGWFILENWMMPDLFGVSPLDQYNVSDEWTYCNILGKEECLCRLQAHWDTYVTEDDFKRFSDYSLNTVRIPMGFWAWIETEDYEPYVQGQLPYLEKALCWADQYGLDVLIDLHGLPGGQNGQDNQGVKGPIEFQDNSTNLERALAALTNMTQTVTADRFNGVVKAIELTNEPYIDSYNPAGMTFDTLANYYVQGYEAVRASEYIANGSQEVMVVIHDAFQPLLNWEYFWSQPSLGLNWTNYALDTHIYDAFGTTANKTMQEHLDTICSLASNIAAAQLQYPVIVGEFSLGTSTYCIDYQSCIGESLNDFISDLTNYNNSLFLRQFWEVQADVYELGAGWIFWSNSNEFGAPWSWSQSAAQNWIPEDPTEKIWPFNSSMSSYCLDIANPIDGDQNLPSFPPYANNISNIDIAVAKSEKTVPTTSSRSTSVTSNITNAPVSSMINSPIASSVSTTATPVEISETSSAKSGARGRIIPSSVISFACMGIVFMVAV